jgi:hypothetical protein
VRVCRLRYLPIVLSALFLSAANTYAAPGDNPACVSVAGLVTYSSVSTLTVDIGGPIGCNGANTDYDRLTVENLTLNSGTLAIRLVNSYQPSGGEVFNVLDWNNSITGTFATIDESQAILSAGLSWNTSQLYISGEISIDAPINAEQVPLPLWMLIGLGGMFLIVLIRHKEWRAQT